jgi:hypothetical protein
MLKFIKYTFAVIGAFVVGMITLSVVLIGLNWDEFKCGYDAASSGVSEEAAQTYCHEKYGK